MLRTVFPKGLKAYLRQEFRRLLGAEVPDLVHRLISDHLARLLARLPAPPYYPNPPEPPCRVLPRTPPPCPADGETGLPIPPQEYWLGYAATADVYLAGGKVNVSILRDAARRAGCPLESAGRILELGCAAGRMLRWLHDLALDREIWGVDVAAAHVRWCQQYLSPPFHFATTTIYPHLPFEDRYFDFVFAGSVFTHIDDLADAWFQELRRVLRPGGHLYVTLHDRKTIDILEEETGLWFSQYVCSVPGYEEARRSDFGVLSLGGGDWARLFVFHDADYLSGRLAPFFRTVSVIERAYNYQTALLLERR
jgi:SAM-dependent methyltransferase